MAAENKIDLLIAAHTKEAEAGLARVRDRFQAIIPTTHQAAANFRAASAALDVKPMRLVSQEINSLREHYQRLSSSGLLSQRELAQAAENLRIKTAQLRGEYTGTNTAMQQGANAASNWATRIKQVAAAYVGYQTVTTVVRSIVEATKEAEQSQFNLQASVKAASREFGNTGTLDFWQGKVKEMSAALKVYSEADVANAVSRTVDMTKRLGMSSEQMEELIKRSADLSAGKTDLQGGIERVTAALRGEAESAEFLGLTLNENYIKAWHEAHDAHGTAWKDLTDLEKAQVRYNVFLEQSAEMQGRAADSANTFSGALAMVKTEVSNAIANNKNLAASLSGVANIIRENADEIGDMASAIAIATGETIKFVVENKNIIAVLAGAGGMVAAVSATVSGLTSLNAALGLIKKAKMAATFTEAAGGLATMAGASTGARTALEGLSGAVGTLGNQKTPDIISSAPGINAALIARLGLYGLLAAELYAIGNSYYSMVSAHNQAVESENRLIEAQERAQVIADRASAQTGIWIKDIHHLNQLLRDGIILRDQEADSYMSLEQAQAKAAAAAEREAAAETQRAASYVEVVAIVERATAAYGDLSEETINAAARQETLTGALDRAKDSSQASAESVENLGDAYFDASLALEKLTAGQEGYEDALKAKLDAEKNYVNAVEQMREQSLRAMAGRNSEEIRALKQKHELQLIAEQERLENGFITQAEFDHLKLQAEENLSRALLDMREDLVEKSAELYGKDSDQYRSAVADKIDAEIELRKAQKVTRAAWEETIGTGSAAKKSADALIDSLREVGRSGRKGGYDAAEGLSRISEAAEDAAEKVKTVWSGELLTKDKIQSDFSAAKSLEDLERLRKKYASTLTYINSRWQHLRDLAQTVQWSSNYAAAKLEHAAAMDAYSQKLNAATPINPTVAGQSATPQTKTMTVNLKAESQTVAATLPEADAGKLLEVLRQAGMVTA